MKTLEISEATIIAEYEALRDEILLRLSFQQQLLNHSLVSAGLIVPIVGLFGVSSIDPHGVLALLLIGPIVSVFLQLIYLKQYVYFQQLASYIASTLGPTQISGESLENKGIPLFSGWERYLNRKLIKSRLVDSAMIFTGFAEGSFPAITGLLYLLAFAASLVAQANDLNLLIIFVLVGWGVLDLLFLVIVFVISWFVRGWGSDLRIEAEESSSV
jgi:hypothetical protein